MLLNGVKKALKLTVMPWLQLESHQDDLVIHNAFWNSDGDMMDVDDGSVKGSSDTVKESSSTPVDLSIQVATKITDNKTGASTRSNVEFKVTSSNNQSIQTEKNPVAKEGKQSLVTSSSSPSAPSTHLSGISSSSSASSIELPGISFSPTGTGTVSTCRFPLFRPIPGLLCDYDEPEASVIPTRPASPVEGMSGSSSSQVAFSSSMPTPAAQEDRVAREAQSSSAHPLPMGQVRPAVQVEDSAHDAPESRGRSATPMGQDTSSVPAVQELATAHGDENELDGQDAEVSVEVAPQTGIDIEAGENEEFDEPAPPVPPVYTIYTLPRHLLTDAQKNYLMWEDWDAFYELRQKTAGDPLKYRDEYLARMWSWVAVHSDAPDVQMDPLSFMIPDEISDLYEDFDPEDFEFKVPPPTQEEICDELLEDGVVHRDFAFNSSAIPEEIIESTAVPAPVCFIPAGPFTAFDFVRNAVHSGTFHPLARFVRPVELFRLVEIGWVSDSELDWADARAQYHIGRVLVEKNPRDWVLPGYASVFPSRQARRKNIEDFENGWKSAHGENALEGVPFTNNRICWIDVNGEECKDSPFEIDQEAYQSFFEVFFKEPRKSRRGSASPKDDDDDNRPPFPPTSSSNKRPRDDDDDDDDNDAPAPSPPKKLKQAAVTTPALPPAPAPVPAPVPVPTPVPPTNAAPAAPSPLPQNRMSGRSEPAVARPSRFVSALRSIANAFLDEDESSASGPSSPTPGPSRKRSAEDSDLDEDEGGSCSSCSSPSKKARTITEEEDAPSPPRLILRLRGNGRTRRASGSRTASSSRASVSAAASTSTASSSSASPSPSPATPDDSQDIEIEVNEDAPMPPAVEEEATAPAPEPPLPPAAAGMGIVPPPGRELRRHETTVWKGEVVSRGAHDDYELEYVDEEEEL